MITVKQRIFLILPTFLLAATACVLPGQTIPTIDPASLSTIVAETASAAQTQTAAPPAQATLPDTAVPEATATESPVPVPGVTNSALEKASDGTSKYTDYDAGFEVTFPKGWLAVRPNTEEYNEALANAQASNEMLYNLLTDDQTFYDAEFDRLNSYPLRPDIEKNTAFGFSYLQWNKRNVTALDSFSMGGYVRELESSVDFPGFRVDVSRLYENVNGVLMIEIGGRRTIADNQGGYIPFYMTVIYFKPIPDSMGRVTITYLQDFQASIGQDVALIMESIKLLEP
ncbi:MAG: hypothetical protein AB1649_12040 [Chloroflexota bacterium]